MGQCLEATVGLIFFLRKGALYLSLAGERSVLLPFETPHHAAIKLRIISPPSQAAVPKYMKLTILPASSASIPAGGAVTQVIKVDNSQQGAKPSELMV